MRRDPDVGWFDLGNKKIGRHFAAQPIEAAGGRPPLDHRSKETLGVQEKNHSAAKELWVRDKPTQTREQGLGFKEDNARFLILEGVGDDRSPFRVLHNGGDSWVVIQSLAVVLLSTQRGC